MGLFPSLRRDPVTPTDGTQDANPQNTVVSPGPTGASSSAGATGSWPAGASGSWGGGNGPRPLSYTEGLKVGLPATSAVVSGTADGVSSSFSKGQYLGGTVKGLRGALAAVPAALNDTVGAAVRSLSPSAEDAGRAALGMPDRQPDAAPNAPTPGAPDSVQPWGREALRAPAGIAPGVPNAPLQGQEDFTSKLASLPSKMPEGLRDGMVYKTKGAHGETVYSGGNVSGDVSGKMLRGDGSSAGPMRGSMQTAAGAPVMGPNGSYVIDNQAPTGAAKQAAIDQALTGPGGTKMTPSDVAIMAANQRDGVDLYRGTSQDASLRGGAGGPGGAGGTGNADLMALAKSPVGTPGRAMAADMLRQQMANAGQRDVANIGADASIAGHRMARDAQLARLQYDMGKDQRDFQAGRSDANFTQRQAAQKALDEQIDSRFTVDGKVDPKQASDYKQFLNNGIADVATQLKASKDPGEQARGKKLEGRTYADMDPQDLQAMEQLWQNRAAAQKNAGWTPGTGNFVDSLRPRDFAPGGMDSRSLSGDHVQLRNGSHVSVNDLTGSTFGVMPKTTGTYDDTIRAAQRAQTLRSR